MAQLEIIQIRPVDRPGAAALDDVILYLQDFLTENKITWVHSINGCSPGRARRVLVGGHMLRDFSFMRRDDIVINTEPLMEPKFSANLAYLEFLKSGLCRVADYGKQNLALLPSGVVAHWLQFPALGCFKNDHTLRSTDCDFLFFGTVNDSRLNAINALREAGYTVRALTGVFGESRNREIMKSRITLNLHFFPSKIFESVRCVASMRLGRPVLSEWVDEPTIPEPFVDSVTFTRGMAADSTNQIFELAHRRLNAYFESARSRSYIEQLNFFSR